MTGTNTLFLSLSMMQMSKMRNFRSPLHTVESDEEIMHRHALSKLNNILETSFTKPGQPNDDPRNFGLPPQAPRAPGWLQQANFTNNVAHTQHTSLSAEKKRLVIPISSTTTNNANNAKEGKTDGIFRVSLDKAMKIYTQQQAAKKRDGNGNTPSSPTRKSQQHPPTSSLHTSTTVNDNSVNAIHINLNINKINNIYPKPQAPPAPTPVQKAEPASAGKVSTNSRMREIFNFKAHKYQSKHRKLLRSISPPKDRQDPNATAVNNSINHAFYYGRHAYHSASDLEPEPISRKARSNNNSLHSIDPSVSSAGSSKARRTLRKIQIKPMINSIQIQKGDIINIRGRSLGIKDTIETKGPPSRESSHERSVSINSVNSEGLRATPTSIKNRIGARIREDERVNAVLGVVSKIRASFMRFKAGLPTASTPSKKKSLSVKPKEKEAKVLGRVLSRLVQNRGTKLGFKMLMRHYISSLKHEY